MSNAPKNNSFAIPYMHLRLRREFKEDYREMEESKAGFRLQDS